MKSHRLPCFGQKSGLIIESGDWSQSFIFFKFLKKVDGNRWEKPSRKEGKTIKINLMELISIISVFKGDLPRWTTVHKFGGVTTPITVERKDTNMIIQIPGYNRFLKYPETVLVQKLLEHIFDEKIEFSTGYAENIDKYQKKPRDASREQPRSVDKSTSLYDIGKKPKDQYPAEQADSGPGTGWVESLEQSEEYCLVPGEITARREKAVAFQVLGKNQLWIPISQIRNLGEYDQIKGLWVKRWLLEKNLAILTTA